MKIEVGKVYKCNDHYVRITSQDPTLKSKGLFSFIGVVCDVDGEITLGSIGVWDVDAESSKRNPIDLQGWLQEVISPAKQQKLDRIALIEAFVTSAQKELSQLKEEIENE